MSNLPFNPEARATKIIDIVEDMPFQNRHGIERVYSDQSGTDWHVLSVAYPDRDRTHTLYIGKSANADLGNFLIQHTVQIETFVAEGLGPTNRSNLNTESYIETKFITEDGKEIHSRDSRRPFGLPIRIDDFEVQPRMNYSGPEGLDAWTTQLIHILESSI